MSARVLVLPGTASPASPNHALAFSLARALGVSSATVSMVSLADYPLPLLDVEDSPDAVLPDAAQNLAELVAAQDALLLVAPDAHGGAAPMPLNALAWIARARRARGRPLEPFHRLVVALASASPGRLGGFRALDAWRGTFLALGADVMGEQFTLEPDAMSDIDPTGDDGDDGRDEPDGSRTRNRVEAFALAVAERAQLLGRHQP